MPRNLLPLVVIAVLSLSAILLAFVFLSSDSTLPTSTEGVEDKIAEESVTAEPTIEATPADSTIADDGKSLWVSPTAGEPISLSYLPTGTQLVLHVRPGEILAHPEGEKTVAALGPWGATAIEQLQSATGVELANVAALTIAVHPTMTGELRTTWRLELVEPLAGDASSLPSSAERTCFVPNGQEDRLLVCCHPDDLAELQEQGDEPAMFPRDMQRLLDRTDRLRSATVVLPTKFFRIEGHKLVSGGAERLRDVLSSLAGDRATAVALSAHWGDSFFLELQSNATLNVSPHHLAKNLQRWIPQATSALEAALAASPPHPHGREIVTRFPAMLQLLSTYTRGMEVDGLGVLRCYLPTIAGHNLVMASELALGLPNEATGGLPEETGPQTLREKLRQVTSLSFPKDTLERSLEILAEELQMEIKIAGGDLQLDGITKNQSFGIDLRDQTVEQILQAIVSQANPDRSAESLADPKQKLVYVLRNPDSTEGVVVVTTRAAAIKRGETLPQVFVQKPE